MGTNQKYSARIHSRRQLVSAINRLKSATVSIADVGIRYETVLPKVSQACEEMIKMLYMVEGMVSDVRDHI